MKSIQFKWNPKIHHFNHKCFLELLLKLISQIQFFLFNYFHPLYYHVLPLVHVGVAMYWNHSVISAINTVEEHPYFHKILR